MFDTSIVRARAIAAPRSSLLISILIHSLAIVAAVLLTVASTQLPAQPPRQLELYRPVELPTAPPPPLGHPAARPQQPAATLPRPKPTAPQQVTAPQVIPDQTPVVPDVGPATTSPLSNGAPIGNGPIGSEIGVPGGVGDNPAATGPGVATIYVPGRDVTSARVISRVEPRFPQNLIHAVRFAVVVVRCVIGKDGQIHDPEIIRSSFPPFNDAVVNALRQWRFAPGMMHGQAVDTWFELTVRFEVR